MLGYAARITLESLIRLSGTVIFLCLAIEVALIGACWQGGDGETLVGVVATLFGGDVPVGFWENGESSTWLALAADRTVASGRILAMAVAIAISFGYTLGFLAGRLRSFPGIRVVLLPFSLLVWAPAVWAVSLCGWWLVEQRGQPIMFDSFPVMDGLNGVEDWWRALFPAAVLGLSVVGTQVRTIATAIAESARPFHVRAAFAQGYSRRKVYYGSIIRSALIPVVESFGRIFPLMLGLQIFVEWAFRFPGLGTLMIDSARAGSFEALLVGGLIMAVLAVGLHWLEEMVKGIGEKRLRSSGVERRVQAG